MLTKGAKKSTNSEFRESTEAPSQNTTPTTTAATATTSSPIAGVKSKYWHCSEYFEKVIFVPVFY